jgi:hypothetical protein
VGSLTVVPVWSLRRRWLVAHPVGRLVQAADEVAVEGLLHVNLLDTI